MFDSPNAHNRKLLCALRSVCECGAICLDYQRLGIFCHISNKIIQNNFITNYWSYFLSRNYVHYPFIPWDKIYNALSLGADEFGNFTDRHIFTKWCQSPLYVGTLKKAFFGIHNGGIFRAVNSLLNHAGYKRCSQFFCQCSYVRSHIRMKLRINVD